MDTQTQTLEAADLFCEEEEGEDDQSGIPDPWGRLFPLGKGFVAQDLVKDDYTFGRGSTCDCCFETTNGEKRNAHFPALSNTHFKISRERRKTSEEDYVVFIHDMSSNGTFVNDDLVGKNKRRVLNSDDEISLSLKTNKAFIFNICTKSSCLQALPKELNDQYILSKILGRGASGEVKLAFDKGTCKKFAVKIISKRTLSLGPMSGQAALEEVNILKSIQHPCIVQVQDVFDTPSTLFIVLELVEGGELFDRLVVATKFSEELSKFYFYQMTVAIKYLHDRGITHRDIKPDNILLASEDEESLIKVTDFGVSRYVGEDSLMKTLCGTPSYLAPEVLQTAGTSGYSKAIDLWSAGVILFVMLAGYPPFSDESKEFSMHDQITQGLYTFHADYWKDVSEEAVDLVKRLLTVCPEDHVTVEGVLEHPWMQDQAVITRVRGLMKDEIAKLSMSPPSLPDCKRAAPLADTADMAASAVRAEEVEKRDEFPVKRPCREDISSTSNSAPSSWTPSTSIITSSSSITSTP